MFSIKALISFFIVLKIVDQIKTLVELPIVEDSNLAITESIIRDTVNKIFTTFSIQEVKHKPKLKQFSTIHNFFVSITLIDSTNLKEIARLTRVNNIDNNTQRFITQINEVLNDDDKIYEGNDTNNVYVTKHIAMFIRKLQYLKERHMFNRNTVINAEILKYLEHGNEPIANVIEENNVSNDSDTVENTLSDGEFWQSSGRRIFRGTKTTIKKFPFMASILFFKKFQCAGSIINNDLVITSASCLQLAWNNRFFRENPAFLSIQVGSDVYESGGDNIAVVEIYFHPQYNPKTLRNNLALLRLKRKIIFKSKTRKVKKIDFDRNAWPMPINSPKITIIGWGAKEKSNVISDLYKNKLSYAELDYYPLQDCQDHYSEDFVTRKNFCAGFLSEGSGACNRDAGGPGVIENTLYGVISFGSPICGAPDSPTVFTKLGFYADWIQATMEQNVPSTYQKTTTLQPKTLYLLDYKPKTTSTIKFYPLPSDAELTTVPINELEYLRMAHDQGFKDFLATMFSADDIKEYFDDTVLNKNKEYKATYALNKSEHIHATTPSTYHIKTDGSPDESKSSEELTIEMTTEYNRKVTVLDNISKSDKNLEEDIMTLIDNLDIDKILLLDRKKNMNQEEIDVKPNRTIKKKQKEYVKVTSSASAENELTISSKQQSVLNFLFLSEENKDKKDDENGGLSIETDNFRDLTFRERRNDTKKQNILSETALYELISLAIDEEAKRLHKQKRYTL